jgi:hypothetical protein
MSEWVVTAPPGVIETKNDLGEASMLASTTDKDAASLFDSS